MAKDYAKRVVKVSGLSKKGARIRLFVIVIFLVFVAGIGAYIYQASLASNGYSLWAYVKGLFVHKTNYTNGSVEAVKKSINQNDQDSSVRFDFYNELPNMQVKVPEETVDKNTSVEKGPVKTNYPSVPSASVDAGYILQFGVFKDAAEANQFRLSLLLSGYDSDIFKISGSSGDVYRVQRGPFTNATEAKRLQQKLKNKGIDSEVIKTS